MSNVVLTPSALLGFLNEIEELKDKEITFDESDEGISVVIGGNEYILDASDSIEVELDDQSFDEVEEANDEGYEEIDDLEATDDDYIEGGIIKELVKTLALGGLIRLTKNALKEA